MATNYQIKTEFSILDKASPALSALGKKGQWLEKNFAGPLAAAEQRFTAFEAVFKKAAIGGFGRRRYDKADLFRLSPVYESQSTKYSGNSLLVQSVDSGSSKIAESGEGNSVVG